MASKKYTLVLALLGLLQTASFAQTQNDASDAYVFDSSKVSVKNMPQYNEFKNNQYPYPARPKDQWEIGGGVGGAFIFGDRAPLVKKYLGGPTGSISIRKALTHVFSIRAGYSGSIASVPQQIPHYPGDFNYGARNETHMGNLDGIFSLNTISHYRGDPKSNLYVFLGYTVAATRVKIYQKVDGAYGLHTLYYPTPGLFTTFGSATINGRHAWGVLHAYSYGAGWTWKLNDKWNIGVEERITKPIVGNDFLDGHQQGNSNDSWSYSTFRINMNIGNKSTRVQPLWWINPNDYVYNELNIQNHQKPKPVILPDGDGDGVTDQFDLEPNTPAGAAVDSHGRAKDTDGDGVPDYKDKEILTPQSCFPVNADGVGTCPEPQCCKDIKAMLDTMMMKKQNSCGLSSLPSITFKAGSAKLSKDAMSILAGAAQQIGANPTCNVKVVGYAADANKRSQQLSWDRVNTVIKYLVEKGGVSEGRIIFSYENQGESNTVDLQPTTETGPNTVPAPHPQYRTTK